LNNFFSGGYYPGRAYDWVGPESGGKCILGNSYVPTAEGLFKIKELVGKIDGFKEKNLTIYTKDEQQVTSHIFHTKSNIYKLHLQDGRVLGGTPEHPILVITQDLNLEWKKLQDITTNDFVCSSFGKRNFSNTNCKLNFVYDEKIHNSTSFKAQHFSTPKAMTEDLARFLGYLTANGSYDNRYGVNFCTNNINVQKNYKKIIKNLFDIEQDFDDSDCPNLHIRSTYLNAYVRYLGLNSLAKNKVIPWSILQSKEDCIKAFIEGYLSCDSYLPDSGAIYLCSASQNLMKQMQIVLNEFGVFSSFSKKRGPLNYQENFYYYLHIPTVYSQTFSDIFSLKKNVSICKGWSKNYVIPYLASNLAKARQVVSKNGVYSNGKISQKINLLGSFNDEMTNGRLLSNEGHLTRNALQELNLEHLKIINQDLFNKVSSLLNENLTYTKVIKICKSKKLHDVYDLTVPSCKQFIANNIVVHNTTHGNAALGQGLLYIPKYTCGNYFDFEGSLDKKWFLNIAGMPEVKPEKIMMVRWEFRFHFLTSTIPNNLK
jgi:intein/homing endonuclease